MSEPTVHAGEVVWVLLYVLDGFPDVHFATFRTWQEAEQERRTRINPKAYWVRRVHLPKE